MLLTAADETRAARLTERERWPDLERHVESSVRMTTHLEERAPLWVRRVPTDARTVTEVARDVIRGSGW